MTLVSPPPALPQIKQVTKLMSHLQVVPEVIWMVPLRGSYMIMVTHWSCPVRLLPQDFLREPLLPVVPLSSSRTSQGVRFYSQQITYLCICVLLTSEEITAISFSSFLFVLWRIFWGGALRDPHGSGIFRVCSWEIGKRRCPGALSGSVLAVSLLGQILRSFPKFSPTCSGFCDFLTLCRAGRGGC